MVFKTLGGREASTRPHHTANAVNNDIPSYLQCVFFMDYQPASAATARAGLITRPGNGNIKNIVFFILISSFSVVRRGRFYTNNSGIAPDNNIAMVELPTEKQREKTFCLFTHKRFREPSGAEDPGGTCPVA